MFGIAIAFVQKPFSPIKNNFIETGAWPLRMGMGMVFNYGPWPLAIHRLLMKVMVINSSLNKLEISTSGNGKYSLPQLLWKVPPPPLLRNYVKCAFLLGGFLEHDQLRAFQVLMIWWKSWSTSTNVQIYILIRDFLEQLPNEITAITAFQAAQSWHTCITDICYFFSSHNYFPPHRNARISNNKVQITSLKE